MLGFCVAWTAIFSILFMDPAIFLHKDIPWLDQIKRAFHYSGSLVMGSDRCPQFCIEWSSLWHRHYILCNWLIDLGLTLSVYNFTSSTVYEVIPVGCCISFFLAPALIMQYDAYIRVFWDPWFVPSFWHLVDCWFSFYWNHYSYFLSFCRS
jgi:hypothetical protein